jgi:hypothetical protein
VPIDIVRSPAPQPSCRTDRGRRPAQRARLDLPPAGARVVRPGCRGRRHRLPARPRRRLGLPVADPAGGLRLRPRLRRRRPHAGGRRPGRRGGLARFVAAARARASASSWTSCPTIRASPIRPRTRGGGTS